MELDKYIRELQFEKVVDQEISKLNPEHKKILEAYAAGINAYVDAIPFLPLEFWLEGIGFNTWTPKDSLMIFKLYSFEMSTQWKTTMLRTALKEKIGQNYAEKLLPTTNANLPDLSIISKHEIPANFANPPKKDFEPKPGATHAIPLIGTKKIEKSASNVWVIHGNYTNSNKPFLASDLHYTKQMPGVFYLTKITLPNKNQIIGATLVGVPLFINGRNKYLAWSISGAHLENMNVYDLNNNASLKIYEFNNTQYPLIESVSRIKVKGGLELGYPVYQSKFGPVIYPHHYISHMPQIPLYFI